MLLGVIFLPQKCFLPKKKKLHPI